MFTFIHVTPCLFLIRLLPLGLTIWFSVHFLTSFVHCVCFCFVDTLYLLMHGSVSYTPAIRGLWETSCKYTIINQTFCANMSMYASFLWQMSVIRQTILYTYISWYTETEVNWVSVIDINVKIICAWIEDLYEPNESFEHNCFWMKEIQGVPGCYFKNITGYKFQLLNRV